MVCDFIIAMSGDYSMEVTLDGISIETRLEIIYQATSIIRQWNKLAPISNICEIFHYTPDEIESIVGQTRSVALQYMSDHMGDHVISKLMGLNMKTIFKNRKTSVIVHSGHS